MSASLQSRTAAQSRAPAASVRSSWCTLSGCITRGLLLPLFVVLLSIAAPLLYRSLSLPAGQPFAFITNSTFIAQPSNFHSRWRGDDYTQDRFFFQWWNFLVYDAETHDHWTIVAHAAKFSSATRAAGATDFASFSLIHRQRAEERDVAHDAIPLADLQHGRDWEVALRKSDGSTPHRITLIDDNTYNVVADFAAGKSQMRHERVRFNLTFSRIHGMYNGLDNEEGNKEHCAVVSTLFGYHSRVSGWIQSGERRFDIGSSSSSSSSSSSAANANRFRAYAAGSWGCQLPSGYPAVQYPWTWLWLSVPGAADGSHPELGFSMGTARFQTNSSLAGDLTGGYANIGVGEQVVAVSWADLHDNTSWAPRIPLTKSSNDGQLRRFNWTGAAWAEGRDAAGEFQLPLQQTFDVETAHWRVQLAFNSSMEQYFRCPVAMEKVGLSGSAVTAGEQTSTAGLQVFSDYRAVGVPTRVQVWKRSSTPEERVAQAIVSRTTQAPIPAPEGADEEQWLSGRWETVVFDGVVDTMNALEYAYQSHIEEAQFKLLTAPQKFD